MYQCRKCQTPVTDLAESMIQGCDSCGSRVFTKRTEKNLVASQESSPIEEPADDIAILIHEAGHYSVNIKALVDRSSGIEPLLVQDKRGVINVLLNPDP